VGARVRQSVRNHYGAEACQMYYKNTVFQHNILIYVDILVIFGIFFYYLWFIYDLSWIIY